MEDAILIVGGYGHVGPTLARTLAVPSVASWLPFDRPTATHALGAAAAAGAGRLLARRSPAELIAARHGCAGGQARALSSSRRPARPVPASDAPACNSDPQPLDLR